MQNAPWHRYVDRQGAPIEHQTIRYLEEIFPEDSYRNMFDRLRRVAAVISGKTNPETGFFEDGIIVNRQFCALPSYLSVIQALAPHIERIKDLVNPVIAVLPASGAVKINGFQLYNPHATLHKSFHKKTDSFDTLFPTSSIKEPLGGMSNSEYQKDAMSNTFPGWHVIVAEKEPDTTPMNFDEFPAGAALAPGFLKLTVDQVLMLQSIYGFEPTEQHVAELVLGQFDSKLKAFPALSRKLKGDMSGSIYDLLSVQNRDVLGWQKFGKDKHIVLPRKGFNIDDRYEQPVPVTRMRNENRESVERVVGGQKELTDEIRSLRSEVQKLRSQLNLAEQQVLEISQRATREMRRADLLQQQVHGGAEQRARAEKQRADYALSEVARLETEKQGLEHVVARQKEQIKQLERDLNRARQNRPESSRNNPPADNGPAYCGFTEVSLRRIKLRVLKKIKTFVAGEYHPDKFPPNQRESASNEFSLFSSIIDRIIKDKERSGR